MLLGIFVVLSLLVVLVVLAGAAAAALAGAASRNREWSDEEYERRRRAPGTSLLATAMKTLGDELGPGGRRVAEEREAIERGEREPGPTADGAASGDRR